MLIIFGFRTLLHVLGTGDFHCPECGTDCTYRLVAPRRWFTLFFIPVIPGSKQSPAVECTRCKSLWDKQVLDLPTTASIEKALGLAMRAIVATSVGRLPDYALPMGMAVAAAEVSAMQSSSYEPADLVRDIASFQVVDVTEYTRDLRGALTPMGSDRLVQGCLDALAVYCTIDQNNARACTAALLNVEQAALSLGLTRSQFEQLGHAATQHAQDLVQTMMGRAA